APPAARRARRPLIATGASKSPEKRFFFVLFVFFVSFVVWSLLPARRRGAVAESLRRRRDRISPLRDGYPPPIARADVHRLGPDDPVGAALLHRVRDPA